MTQFLRSLQLGYWGPGKSVAQERAGGMCICLCRPGFCLELALAGSQPNAVSDQRAQDAPSVQGCPLLRLRPRESGVCVGYFQGRTGSPRMGAAAGGGGF